MNQELSESLAKAERMVAGCRQPIEELTLYGGNPPTDSLEKYNAMRTEALTLDIEIAKMLPPKKGEEKKVLEAIQRLEMLINSVETYSKIIEGEIKQAKKNFYEQRTQKVNEIEKVEAAADEQILTAFRALAAALRIHWLATEKKFRLSQYIQVLANEFSTIGVSNPPPSIIYLGWGEKIQANQTKFNEAYLLHFLSKLGGLGDNISSLTIQSLKEK
jgi:hypothetical protein